MSWSGRLGLVQRLSEAGVDEITLPSHATFEEEQDIVRAYRRLGLTAPLVAKGPGIELPLRSGWQEHLRRHADLGAEIITPLYKWPFQDTLRDFDGDPSKSAVIDMILESAAFTTTLGVRVQWIVDSMRTRLDTVVSFYKALPDASVDGVYVRRQPRQQQPGSHPRVCSNSGGWQPKAASASGSC